MKDLQSVKKAILERLTLGQVLRNQKRITYLQSEEQLSCPFHGADRKKSSRYYRDTDSMYCWVCKEAWDLFGYIEKQEQIGFGDVIRKLIKELNIDLTKLPDTKGIAHRKLEEYKVKPINVDDRKLRLEKLHSVISMVRDDIEFERYKRMVHAYMLLKYAVPEEKFLTAAIALKEAILKRLKEAQDVGHT